MENISGMDIEWISQFIISVKPKKGNKQFYENTDG